MMTKLTRQQKEEFDKLVGGVKYYQNGVNVTAIIANGGKLPHSEKFFKLVKVEGNENEQFSKS